MSQFVYLYSRLSMTTTTEYETLFYTALKWLHSSNESATDQLKALLDKALAQKSVSKSNSSAPRTFSVTHGPMKLQEKNVTVDTIKLSDLKASKEAAKRSAKVPLPNSPSKPKKPKAHSSPSSRNPSPEPIKPKIGKEEKVEPKILQDEDSETTDVEEESTDAGEFALEMGLACVICRNIDFMPGNQPVECAECHNLYHQECHKPPITDGDVSDPRNIWYCAKCTKSMEKISKKTAKTTNKSPNPSSSASFQSAINSGRATAIQLLKAKQAEKESTIAPIQPFKRMEMKVTQSSNGLANNNGPSTPTKPTGLAGFAATVSRTTSSSLPSPSSNQAKPTTSTLSSLPSTTAATSTSASISKADKRIQQMKKKAASSKKMLIDK
ncbi:integrator complex subunit 12-like isoform X2 [Brevipalpus obovatus]|uniref:integrator complex subunit 12-like isoform X2 n=1 Tax=Brevipalpus obovatus TaxID=246614 RepID=UPI003D9F004B